MNNLIRWIAALSIFVGASPASAQWGWEADPQECTFAAGALQISIAGSVSRTCGAMSHGTQVVVTDAAAGDCSDVPGAAGGGSESLLLQWDDSVGAAGEWKCPTVLPGGFSPASDPADNHGGFNAAADARIVAAARTGVDGTLVTGTAGSNGHCAEWDTNGDLVTAGAVCGSGSFTPDADPGVDHSSYVAGHTNGTNCAGGSYPLGVSASGNSESCTDASTETDLIVATHTAVAAAHHTATVNTNAQTICVTADTVLDAEGDCVALGAGAHGNGANCSAGSYALGVDANGAVESCTDASTETDSIVTTHTGTTDAHHDESPGTAGQVLYSNGSGLPDGDAGMTYNDASNTLTVGAITLPDDEGTNAHVLRGNEATDYKCVTDGAMSDGDIALVSRLGDNALYICDEDAVAETDMREVVSYGLPDTAASGVLIKKQGDDALEYGLVVEGASVDDGTAALFRVQDNGQNLLCEIGYLGDMNCVTYANAAGTFNLNAAGRLQVNQIQIYDATPAEISGRIRKNEEIADDDYDLEFAQLSNALTAGSINNGTRLILKSDGPVAIWTNTDDTTASGFEICDDDNSACGVFDPPAAMTQQTYDLPDASGTMGLRRGVRAETSATTYDIGATAARTALEGYNGYHHICNNSSGGCTWTLPAAVASATETMHICFGTLVGAGESWLLTVGSAAGDTIIGSGETCTAGSTISVTAGTTAAACVTAVDANTWWFDESKGNWGCD